MIVPHFVEAENCPLGSTHLGLGVFPTDVPMTLAIFDLDNTLIAGDSDHLWGEFLCDRGIVDEEYFRRENARFFADYQRGELDIEAYLAFALEPLAGKTMASLAQIRDEFLRERISRLMLPKASKLLDSHRTRGHRLLVITATNEFVTRPIVTLLGIDDLLGCALEVRDGVISGRPTGTLTYREGKVTRLTEWLAAENESLEGAWFYSDSHNDLPLLQRVSNPVAVDPDERLTAHAKAQGWPILSLR